MTINILGISAYYHDSAAALIVDGKVMAAASEERFTRKKGDASFPKNAILYCLESHDLALTDIDYVVYYDKPIMKFDRLIKTALANHFRGLGSLLTTIPNWTKKKLNCRDLLTQELRALSFNQITQLPPILFTQHHQAHAAAAFFPSPHTDAAVLCIDGVGEWATTSVWHGKDNKLIPKWEMRFPHSLGLLYSAFTYYIGFKVNFGEYKLMGLAPYGKPIYKDLILDKLLTLKDDGTFRLNRRYFNFEIGNCMISKHFETLFGQPARKAEGSLSQFHMDIASSIQAVTEEVIFRLAKTIHQELGCDTLCLAGGVALNCVVNGKLKTEGPFKNIWIQPAAGDAGSAVGAALTVWHEHLNNPRVIHKHHNTLLGPEYDDQTIQTLLDEEGAVYQKLDDDSLFTDTANHLQQGKVVGWFQGRMEFGPRALGNRSILGDPRAIDMQKKMNLKIKFRESFRPFAPAVLAEKASDYFQVTDSPYMLLVSQVNENRRIPLTKAQQALSGMELLSVERSEIPAVTHVDNSARVQTVTPQQNQRFYQLLSEFDRITGCPVLINTSMNVRGEPIVCSPKDAFKCFIRTHMDILVLGNYVLVKEKQPESVLATSTLELIPLD